MTSPITANYEVISITTTQKPEKDVVYICGIKCIKKILESGSRYVEIVRNPNKKIEIINSNNEIEVIDAPGLVSKTEKKVMELLWAWKVLGIEIQPEENNKTSELCQSNTL